MKGKYPLNILLIVFFASGFSSLMYQVAWQRILTLYYSVENISTTLIVSVYMLGLGLGAVLGGYLTERIKHKIAFYVVVELLIGLFGYISIPFLEFLGKSTAGSNYLISFICMFSFLSFPTILMGTTLPLLTKIFNDFKNNFFRSISYLYFINTLGASVGCLFTSYIFISFFGLDISIYCAAAINIIIAISVFIYRKKLSKEEKNENTEKTLEYIKTTSPLNSRLVYLIVFVTGFIAIGYEIIWFRIIGTIVKASPYAFSSVLFIYLLGIALGSYFMKKSLTHNTGIDKKNLFFTLQFLIAVFVLLSFSAYYYLVRNVSVFSTINSVSFATIHHPYLGFPRWDSPSDFLIDTFRIFDVFIWPFIFVFFPTLLMGASFPLITSLGYKNEKEGYTVGKVYFFNVIGNVTGGLLTGLLFLKILGTEHSIILLSIPGILFILCIKNSYKIFRLKYKITIAVLLIVLGVYTFQKKKELYNIIHPKIIFNAGERKIINEGVDGVIVTYSYQEKLATYINGMPHGGRVYPEFYFEAIETLSYARKIKNILVIGFGTGSTIETILKLHPKPKITLIELSPTLIENLIQIDYLKSFLEDESLKLIYADGRKYLNNNREKFDVIFMDPLNTTTSYSNNIYSKQFFELIRDDLAPDGVFMTWMDEYNVVPKTLCSVFPYVHKYSFFCIASNSEHKQNTVFKYAQYDQYKSFSKTYYDRLLQLDREERFPTNRPTILKNNNYPINEDYKPRCEYFIGLRFRNKYFPF